MARHHTERGSSTLFISVAALAFFLIVGFVVDGGGKIQATQQADQIAREAARQGGQSLNPSQAMQGITPDLAPAKAKAAARRYLRAAGATGTVTVSGPNLHVEATITYTPVFLSMIGIGTSKVTGVADSASTRVLAGEEK